MELGLVGGDPIFFHGSCGKPVKTKKHQLQANKSKEKSKRLMYLRRIIFVYQNDEGMAHPLSALQVVIYLLAKGFQMPFDSHGLVQTTVTKVNQKHLSLVVDINFSLLPLSRFMVAIKR
jgi:hypothetical protein